LKSEQAQITLSHYFFDKFLGDLEKNNTFASLNFITCHSQIVKRDFPLREIPIVKRFVKNKNL